MRADDWGEGLGKLRGEDAKKGERMRGEEGVSGKSSADNFERSLNRETILGSIPKTNQEKKKTSMEVTLSDLVLWSFYGGGHSTFTAVMPS